MTTTNTKGLLTVPNSEITAAHDPHLPADELDDIREHAERLPDSAGSAKELRSLLLQALDDLGGAYARIAVAYERLEQRARAEARLVNAFESLIQDTDGDDIGPDEDIPVGEIRRVFHEATTANRPYVAPGGEA